MFKSLPTLRFLTNRLPLLCTITLLPYIYCPIILICMYLPTPRVLWPTFCVVFSSPITTQILSNVPQIRFPNTINIRKRLFKLSKFLFCILQFFSQLFYLFLFVSYFLSQYFRLFTLASLQHLEFLKEHGHTVMLRQQTSLKSNITIHASEYPFLTIFSEVTQIDLFIRENFQMTAIE